LKELKKKEEEDWGPNGNRKGQCSRKKQREVIKLLRWGSVEKRTPGKGGRTHPNT